MIAANRGATAGQGAPQVHAPEGHAPTRNVIVRYWRGDGPLWRVYWLYGVLGSAVLAALYWFALAAGLRLLQQVLLPVIVLYTAWILVAVWRCAFNARQEFYGHLARGLTIAWAINVTMLVVFLELGLLTPPVH